MKKTVYDTTKFAELISGWGSLASLKQIMLEAIGNIAVAVSDRDTDRVISIQTDLMWVVEVLGAIEEMEVEL